MNKKETSRGEVVANVVKSTPVVGLGKDLLELVVDTLLESGVIKDIPFVNTVVGIFNSVSTVKDHLLATKLIQFLNQLSEIPLSDRKLMVDKLNEDDKFAGKMGSALIEILDRMESEKKPELAAKFFAAYANEVVTFSQLRYMLYALERIPTFEIYGLVAFSKISLESSMDIEQSTLLAYVNAGLATSGGFVGDVIVPTDLCGVFVKCMDVSLK
jgi:hypothetical protein